MSVYGTLAPWRTAVKYSRQGQPSRTAVKDSRQETPYTNIRRIGLKKPWRVKSTAHRQPTYLLQEGVHSRRAAIRLEEASALSLLTECTPMRLPDPKHTYRTQFDFPFLPAFTTLVRDGTVRIQR